MKKHINNIVLIGFMGTGKSTIARRLAQRLDWELIDIDLWVETAEGMTISNMFKIKGERYFREAETKAIKDILQYRKQVIASGGGAVLAEENRKAMLEHAFVVALKADVRTIINRVSRDRNRPLLKGNVSEKVMTLLEERKHAYDFAHLQVNTSANSIDETVELIMRHLSKAMRS